MKKYKIIIEHFNEETRECEGTETLNTKPITEDRLKEIIKSEIRDKKSVCWQVLPRPKGFKL